MKKNLYDELTSFSSVNFREIYKRFIYINCREMLDEMFPGDLDERITGIFAYCYIDRTEGISFRPVLLAAMSETSVQVYTFPHQEDTIYILRLRDGEKRMGEHHDGGRHMYLYPLEPEKYSFFDLSVINVPIEEYSEFKKSIDSNYDAESEVEELRSEIYRFLDPFRHEWYPDDVKVLLFGKEKGMEEVWVRLMFANGEEFFGELLNEPYQDYGCHQGEIIGLMMTKGEDRVLAYDGRKARKSET